MSVTVFPPRNLGSAEQWGRVTQDTIERLEAQVRLLRKDVERRAQREASLERRVSELSQSTIDLKNKVALIESQVREVDSLARQTAADMNSLRNKEMTDG